MLKDHKNLTESNTSSSTASDQAAECQLVIRPNNLSSEDPQLKMSIQLFDNIQLNFLIKQFEEILNKVKQLELHYLLQPTQIATFKLKELQKITEELACDYYDDYCCANKNCCNELGCSEDIDDIERQTDCNDTSKYCEKSCRCSSNEDDLNQNKKMTEKRNNRASKCNPCKCTVDASGKKVKTLECRLASVSKKHKRNELETFELDKVLQSKRDDTKLPLKTRRSPTNIVAERRISNSKLEIQTNLTNFKLNVKKENTAIEDITYQNARERNQAIYCNLSSESSTDEYYSDSSSDEISYTKPTHAFSRGISGRPTEGSNDTKKGTQVDCCGCGQRVETIKVAESETCPCGCGDLVTLPEGKYVDRPPFRCDNCGVVLTELSSKDKKLESSKVYNKSGNDSNNKKQCQEFRLIPYSDMKIGIEVLDDESYGTGPIFTDLGDFLKTKNNRQITPIPAYIR